jgi:hypothetical protein
MPEKIFARRRRTALALGMLVMTGCADTAIIGNTYYDIGYVPGEWSGNDLPVVVRGGPAAIPQSELDAAVARNLDGVTFGVPTRFVPAVAGTAPTYRVVLIFNPPPGVGGPVLCNRPEPPSAAFGTAPTARLPLIAAFCRGDRAVTYAQGTIALGDGVGSDAFRRGIADFGMALFPPVNPEGRGGMEFTT